jgi:hypothetical protein
MLLYLLLVAHQAGKPLHLDSTDFPEVAAATAATGKPIYYRGEQSPNHLGTYHPPLYIYALAGWFKIFDSGAAQARTFGAMCALLLGGATLLLAGLFLSRPQVGRLAVWFWPLFLLNPYTLQCSAVPDIDTSIYGPLLTLLVWAALRPFWSRGSRVRQPLTPADFALVVLILALCLWAKLTTVLLFLPLLAVLYWLHLGWRAGLAWATAVIGAGIGLFLATYFAYCAALDLPASYTFRFLLASMAERGRLQSPLDNLVYMGAHLVSWSGMLPWAASLLVGVGVALAAWRRDPRAAPLLAVLVTTGLSLLYYCSRVLTFGNAPFKYTYVHYGVAVACLAWLAARLFGPRPPRWVLLLGAASGLVGFGLGLRYLRDDLIRGGAWRAATLLLVLVPVGLLLCGLAARWRSAAPAAALGAALAVAGVGWHTGMFLGTAAHQAAADYSTDYDYGQEGLAEVASFIRINTAPGEVIASMKDVGFLAGRPFVENYLGLYFGEEHARAFIAAMESRRVRIMVFTEGLGQDQLVVQPFLHDWVQRNTRLVTSFGNYRVYSPRDLAPQPPPDGR